MNKDDFLEPNYDYAEYGWSWDFTPWIEPKSNKNSIIESELISQTPNHNEEK